VAFPLANESVRRTITFIWNGNDTNGTAVPVGTYFLTLTTPNKRVTVRLVKLE
jgi:flagellar hook assembly protein FlgD